jgi:Cu/Ag efflux pump CusA
MPKAFTDVGLKPASELVRPVGEISADIRSRLSSLPAAIAVGQPISHRIDHMLSGVRSQIAVKIFGDDLDTLRGQADILRGRLAIIPGIADLEIEKQVLAPLLFEAERPGTETLHPVAVVIFSGLISSTLLDTFLTPAMFWLFGHRAAERLMSNSLEADAL